MAASDFGQHTARFLDWFKKLPGATFHDAVRIVDLRERGAGRGIGEFGPRPFPNPPG